jgi:hypothetical protein
VNTGASSDLPIADDLAIMETIDVPRDEEWHATVLGSVTDWVEFCNAQGWTPLFIELSNGALQLMCASDTDPRSALLNQDQFTLLRVKHEVRELLDKEKPLYYEAHVKLDGVYRPDRPGASRDLLRSTLSSKGGRWYLTRRNIAPLDLTRFREDAVNYAVQSTIAGVEGEIVLLDTNPDLDKDWRI